MTMNNNIPYGMMRGIRVFLVKGIMEGDLMSYYIEAGDDNGDKDGGKRFDHHNEFAGNPAPCVDGRIRRIPDYSTAKVTHSDANILFALLEMLGLSHVINQDLIDLDLMGEIDSNGAMILPNLGLDDPTRQCMVGISVISGELGFPRWNGKDIDVTEIVEKLILRLMDVEKVIRLGKEKMIKGKEAYQRCKEKTYTGGKVIFLCVESPEDSFDGNLALVDGYKIAVIYSRRKESISLRIHPDVGFDVRRQFGEITFAGHKGAAGSKFGEKCTKEEAGVVRGIFEHLLA